MARYLDPKNDLVFKKIFGHHPALLKSFLNAILPLPDDCVIESLTYLSPESVPELAALKNSIVDVRCCDNHGRHFIVEMQLQWTGDFIKRMLFNTAATYVRQLEKGKKYEHLSPVYGLALLDDTFTSEEKWFHHYRMANVHDGSKNLDDIQLVLIELPKFKPNNIVGKKLTVLWLRFLKEIKDGTEVIDPSLFEVEEIKEALRLLEVASYNAAELLAYDQRWDVVSSERTLISGKFAEGKAEGKAEERNTLVMNMHHEGLLMKQICTIAKLSQDEVQKIIEAAECSQIT
ncbi:MAG: Rpn family recombination-promoting nuclease/putative transposase [Verrucomicrobiae bacterium]|nr:Rpn family recombination-promoting nuclease/putative transposase [Verrucomicrobiae bacterium]